VVGTVIRFYLDRHAGEGQALSVQGSLRMATLAGLSGRVVKTRHVNAFRRSVDMDFGKRYVYRVSTQSDGPSTVEEHPERAEAAGRAAMESVWNRFMSRAAKYHAIDDEADAVTALFTDIEAITAEPADVKGLIGALALIATRAYRLLGYPEQTGAHKLAHEALQAAIAGDWDAAGTHVSDAVDIEGGIYVCLMAWCDAYVMHATDGKISRMRGGVETRIGHIDADTGKVMKPGDPNLPARAAWAGDLIAARVRMDQPGFDALLEKIPAGDVGSYIGAVVECIAGTTRTLPRGWMNMGHAGCRHD
jgi:hypothetical protein